MKIAERYRWEAEDHDGRIITVGADLSRCKRISFIPNVAGIRRNDLVGVKMQRRFGRGFIRVIGVLPDEYVHCVVADTFRFYLRCSDGTVLITPVDYELYL